MKHFELRFTKKLLLTSLLISVVSLIFIVLGVLKIRAIDVAENSSQVNIPSTYVNIGEPHGLVMSSDNEIWYVDRENFRLVKMNASTNTIIRTVGRLWSLENEYNDQIATDGEFDGGIVAIAKDDDGYLYVLSTFAFVYKFDPNGGYIENYNLQGISSPNGLVNPQDIWYDAHTHSFFIANKGGNRIEKFTKDFVLINGFGSSGNGPGEFNEPVRVTTDDDGNIYVSDGANARLQIFNTNYVYQTEIKHWTPGGESEHSFEAIAGAIVLSNGTIAIENQNGPHTVLLFTKDGNHFDYLDTFGGGGSDDWNMDCPTYISRDSEDNLYISDPGINSITKFTGNGTFVSSMRNASNNEGKFYRPVDVAYHGAGNHMFILDVGSEPRIQEFYNDGTYIKTILSGQATLGSDSYRMTFTPDGKILVSNPNDIRVFTQDEETGDWSYSTSFGSPGTGNGEFDAVRGMTFDTDGNLYVADSGNSRIQIFNSSFEYIGQFGDSDRFVFPQQVVFDTSGNMYIPDTDSIQKFSSAGTWLQTIASGLGGVNPQAISIDNVNNIIYVSETWGHRIEAYSTSGTLLKTIGSWGGGQVQFKEPTGSAINPITGTLTVSDWLNSRVQAFHGGNRILNLISSANVIRTDGGHYGESLSEQSWVPSEGDPLTNIPARLLFGDYVVADFNVNLTTDRDWSGVNVLSLPYNSKALVVKLNQTYAPGISDTHSLYVYKYDNQTSVNVCPQANTLEDVGPSCTDEYPLTLALNSDVLSVQAIDGKEYWKIDDLTGTGAFSTLFETGFSLKDEMNRLQVNTGSNHNIQFGTTYDLTHTGDTIKVTFGPEWNFDDLNISNISLIDDGGSPLTLSADGPDTNTWGFGIVDTEAEPHVLTFTAPTDGTGYINAGSTISILINNAVVINPIEPESYQIDIRLDSDTTPGPGDVEVGSVDVSIVDSDQVNITGFVNAFMSFDLDTTTPSSSTYEHCDADSCLSYEAGPVANNYTVDLGELTMIDVNKSGSPSNHMGDNKNINSIYFDLSTNSPSGAVVTYKSLNGELRGPGHNSDPDLDMDIPSTDGYTNIVAGTSAYGIQMSDIPTYTEIGTGSQEVNCGSTLTTYCVMTQTASSIYTVNGPIADARGKIDVAAAISGTVVPGSYSDEITFVATSTF